MMPPPAMPATLWTAVTPDPPPRPALDGERRADVAVVGAGFTGLSAALAPAARGRRVVMLDAARVGWGASGRNNGQVIPTLTGAEPDAIVARHGETGERFVRLVAGSAEALFGLVRTTPSPARRSRPAGFSRRIRRGG